MGFYSIALPVLLSIRDSNDSRVIGYFAVPHIKEHLNPGLIGLGKSRTTIWLWMLSCYRGGSFLGCPSTDPDLIFKFGFLWSNFNFTPTMLPALDSRTGKSHYWIETTVALMFPGQIVTLYCSAIFPVLIIPIITSFFSKCFSTKSLRGLSVGLLGSTNSYIDWMRVGPLYQGVFEDFSVRFCPSHAESGTKFIFWTLNPIFFNNY